MPTLNQLNRLPGSDKGEAICPCAMCFACCDAVAALREGFDRAEVALRMIGAAGPADPAEYQEWARDLAVRVLEQGKMDNAGEIDPEKG